MAFVSSRETHLPEIPFWSIPMLYSGATLVPGLIFPPLEYRYLKDFARGVRSGGRTEI